MQEEETQETIAPVNIRDEMRDCFLDYAMSVIVSRALPDVRDGLKPVHRRALFAMNALGNTHNKPYLKSARVVGDVIGKYHPHGDAAVYLTIVRMAQDFSMRYPLVDGQGNFGSIDGDSAAAMRYTEIRMKHLSEEMLKDLEKETVDWRPNYDDSLEEPTVLPTKVPNLLVNGSSGIAVGMSTNIPPHNLREIMGGLRMLLDKEETSVDDLMEIVQGPDFPTGGEIQGTIGIKRAYKTGRGNIQIRAIMEVVPGEGGRERIIVKNIPYQVNKAKLIERIAELVRNKEMKGISDIRDESNKEGIRICIDLKKGEIAGVVINRLYKSTPLQISFSIIFLSISNGVPKVMDLREQLLAFINHRREVVIRRTLHELKKAQEKRHLLEGLKTAIEHIDTIVEIIKKAESPTMAKEGLRTRYELSDKQSQAILDMRLQRLTGLERGKIIEDYNAVVKDIARLEGILGSDEIVKDIIRGEFDDISEKYGDGRKTQIVANPDEIVEEDLIKEEENIVTITHQGYIKRMPLDTYKAQRRGGMGVKGAGSSDDDFFVDIFMANTHATILFFTNKGIVFSKKVYEIPEGGRVSKGRNLANFINIPGGEKVTEAICLPKNISQTSLGLFFITKRGLIKRTLLSEFRRMNYAGGLRAIKIQEGDTLLRVTLTEGTKDIILCSDGGKIIRFRADSVRPMGRISQGVKGMTVKKQEKIIGMEVVDDTTEILTVTEKGLAKRTKAREFTRHSRGGQGVLAMRLAEKTGKIAAVRPVEGGEDLVVITNKGQVIRFNVEEVNLQGRISQGVKIIRPKEGEKVVAVEKIARHD